MPNCGADIATPDTPINFKIIDAEYLYEFLCQKLYADL